MWYFKILHLSYVTQISSIRYHDLISQQMSWRRRCMLVTCPFLREKWYIFIVYLRDVSGMSRRKHYNIRDDLEKVSTRYPTMSRKDIKRYWLMSTRKVGGLLVLICPFSPILSQWTVLVQTCTHWSISPNEIDSFRKKKCDPYFFFEKKMKITIKRIFETNYFQIYFSINPFGGTKNNEFIFFSSKENMLWHDLRSFSSVVNNKKVWQFLQVSLKILRILWKC